MRILMLVHLYSRSGGGDFAGSFQYQKAVVANILVDASRADLIAAGLVDRMNYPIIVVTATPFDEDVSDAFDRLVAKLDLPARYRSADYQLRPMSFQICR